MEQQNWRKYIIVFVSFSILFIGCKKETFFPANTHISGHVTDRCTGQPVSNLEIGLYYANPGSNRDKIKTTSTDSDGNYTISFYASNGASYTFLTGRGSVENIKRGKSQRIDFTVWSTSNNLSLSLTTVNTSPQTNSDSIYVNVSSPNDNTYNFHNHYLGQTVNVTNNITFWGCFPYKVYVNWVFRKNSIITNFEDTVTYTNSTPPTFALNY